MSSGHGPRRWSQTTPMGVVTVTATDGGITGLAFGPGGRDTADRELAELVDGYFAGDIAALDALPVDLAGRTPFSRAVLEALRAVPPGATTTYRELAVLVGRPGASRAVGQAVGANPIPVVVPCHRVLATDGTLGGYSGGLDRKRWLLAHEGVPLPVGGWTSRRALAVT